MKWLATLLLLFVPLCSGAQSLSCVPYPKTPISGYWGDWYIGPIINGKDYSIGMPLKPTTVVNDGWVINFPSTGGKVDYISLKNPQPLLGARAISVTYEITGGGFTPYEEPTKQALFGLEFQRRGDNWSASGAYASYRWYGHPALTLQAGKGVLMIPLVLSAWSNVYGQSTDQAGFNLALTYVDNISITFGHSSGVGHGVYATQPSTFRMVKFEVLR